jgi:hypothetical protein
LEKVEDFDLLFRFLGQCPRLESLGVRVLNNRVALPDVHATIIPHLHTLSGPPKLHQLLTSVRPVRSAEVPLGGIFDAAPPQELIHVYFAIARSSAPIRSLTLMPTEAADPEFLAAITILFPGLRGLSLTLTNDPYSPFRHRRHNPPPVELEWPDLDDVTAFDDAPADNISDDETEESPSHRFDDT